MHGLSSQHTVGRFPYGAMLAAGVSQGGNIARSGCSQIITRLYNDIGMGMYKPKVCSVDAVTHFLDYNI